MSFESLSLRLSTLQETTLQVRDLIYRLAHLKFQPGSIPLHGSEGDVSAELSEEIHELLKEQSEDLELLEQEVADLSIDRNGVGTSGKDKDSLVDRVGRVKGELKVARSAFRHAQLNAKASLEEARRTERALLLRSLTTPSPPSSTSEVGPQYTSLFQPRNNAAATKESAELQASSDVTMALRRTHNLLSSELSRSQFAHDTLKESTAALASLGETYSSLDSMLNSSRQLLGTLLKSQKSDTWYLETAFMVLAVTVGWLIFRRWVYGPAWWLVWLPIRTFWRSWMGVFSVLGLRGSVKGVAVTGTGEGSSGGVGSGLMSGSGTPSLSVAGTPTQVAEDAVGTEGNLIEEVGRIIDGSAKDTTAEGNEQDAQRNPKKRMWEEDKEAGTKEPSEKVKVTDKDEL